VRTAVTEANRAAELGFAAALFETPHGEKSLERIEAQLLYFRSVADRVKIPVLIANRPQATGINLDAEALLALANHPNIAGVADHSGDCAKIPQLGGWPVLWGEARSIWQALQAGAAGAMLAIANAIPYSVIALWEAHRTREEEAGLDWQARIAAPSALLEAEGGPGALKHAMDLNGYYGGPPRLPFTASGSRQKMQIERAIEHLKS
jgi:4-hydroxy-2-oxoglutarate aldolase